MTRSPHLHRSASSTSVPSLQKTPFVGRVSTGNKTKKGQTPNPITVADNLSDNDYSIFATQAKFTPCIAEHFLILGFNTPIKTPDKWINLHFHHILFTHSLTSLISFALDLSVFPSLRSTSHTPSTSSLVLTRLSFVSGKVYFRRENFSNRFGGTTKNIFHPFQDIA